MIERVACGLITEDMRPLLSKRQLKHVAESHSDGRLGM
jgi:hypothetical protein